MDVDLLYANSSGEIGILKNYSMDEEIGDTVGNNSFEIKTSLDNNKLSIGDFVYIENEEYGGIVDYYKVDTKQNLIYYGGRTWRGVLEGRYMMGSIDIWQSIDIVTLFDYIFQTELRDFYEMDLTPLGITVPVQTLNTDGKTYEVVMRLCVQYNVKLKFRFNPETQKIIVFVERTKDITSDFEITSDLFYMNIKKDFGSINHLECYSANVGSWVELFVNGYGNIVDTQYFYGAREIVGYYNDSSQTRAELKENGKKYLQNLLNINEIKITLNGEIDGDVGDSFTVTEEKTSTTVTQKISRKIATITEDEINVQYEARP